MNRQEIIRQIKSKRSILCIGLDSDIEKIPTHILELEDPIFEFAEKESLKKILVYNNITIFDCFT